MDRPRPHSSSSRLNALSPLQAFSPLQAGAELRSPPDVQSSALARSGSSKRYGKLGRSLSGRERALSTDQRRQSIGFENASDVTTRLILVKAPAAKDGTLRQ